MELNEEKLKEVLDSQRKEYQNYLGTLSESFESQVKIVAESLSGIQGQLNAVKEMVAKSAEDIEVIKMDIQFIKQGLKRKVDLDEFESLEKRVAFLERKAG